MEPYYADDLVTLYHGDCREITAWLEADVLVTDPPYGRDWQQGRLRRNHTDNLHGIANDKTTAVRDAALAMWGDRPAIVFGDLMLPPPARTKQVLIYGKPSNAGLRGAILNFRRDAEAIYLIGSDWSAGLGGDSSILRTGASHVGGRTGLGGRTGHPNEKPVDVLGELIRRSPGVVADPFAGSGTTLAAAKLLGRKCVGVELEERHCETTARRLSAGVLDFGEIA